jgi:hypothetical protein
MVSATHAVEMMQLGKRASLKMTFSMFLITYQQRMSYPLLYFLNLLGATIL